MRCIYYDKYTECKFYQHFHVFTIGHGICVHCWPYRLVKLFVYLNFNVHYIPLYKNGPYLGVLKIETILIWEWCIGCVWISLIVENWKLFIENTVTKLFLKIWIVLWDPVLKLDLYFFVLIDLANSARDPVKKRRHQTQCKCVAIQTHT